MTSKQILFTNKHLYTCIVIISIKPKLQVLLYGRSDTPAKGLINGEKSNCVAN